MNAHAMKDLGVLLLGGLGVLAAMVLGPSVSARSGIDPIWVILFGLFSFSVAFAVRGPTGKRERHDGPWWPQMRSDLGAVWLVGGSLGLALGVGFLLLASSGSMRADGIGPFLAGSALALGAGIGLQC
ncbi:MAG: hypothetical protein AAGA48_17145 [Myxococcota bacterium]